MNYITYQSEVLGTTTEFSGVENLLIQQPEVQHLQNVSQRGVPDISQGGPKGEHNRFNHSLDVLSLLIKFHRLDNPECKFQQELRIAALLHDIGHFPFSHDFEWWFEKFMVKKYGKTYNHKIRTKELILANTGIRKIIEDAGLSIHNIIRLIMEKDVIMNGVHNPINSSKTNADHIHACIADPYYFHKQVHQFNVESLINDISRTEGYELFMTQENTAYEIFTLIEDKNNIYYAPETIIIAYLASIAFEKGFDLGLLNENDYDKTDKEIRERLMNSNNTLLKKTCGVIFSEDQKIPEEFSVTKKYNPDVGVHYVKKIYAHMPELYEPQSRTLVQLADICPITRDRIAQLNKIPGSYYIDTGTFFRANNKKYITNRFTRPSSVAS